MTRQEMKIKVFDQVIQTTINETLETRACAIGSLGMLIAKAQSIKEGLCCKVDESYHLQQIGMAAAETDRALQKYAHTKGNLDTIKDAVQTLKAIETSE